MKRPRSGEDVPHGAGQFQMAFGSADGFFCDGLRRADDVEGMDFYCERGCLRGARQASTLKLGSVRSVDAVKEGFLA